MPTTTATGPVLHRPSKACLGLGRPRGSHTKWTKPRGLDTIEIGLEGWDQCVNGNWSGKGSSTGQCVTAGVAVLTGPLAVDGLAGAGGKVADAISGGGAAAAEPGAAAAVTTQSEAAGTEAATIQPTGAVADATRAGLSAAEDGAGALRFSQTTASSTFRNGPMARRTIGDVSSRLRSGAIKSGELPVDVITRGGNSLIMNTRSSLALTRGGVSPAEWAINDVTGDAFMENVLTGRLASNGLTDAGTDVLRITGAGQWASWLG